MVDMVESLAIERAKEILGLNLQTFNRIQEVRQTVLPILIEPGDKLSWGWITGGHLTHGATVSFSVKPITCVYRS